MIILTYQILSRYEKHLPFGEWQVGIFHDRKQAQEYVDRTVTRYINDYGKKEFEMKIVEVTKEEGEQFNNMLFNLID